jgi:hypothetical protein
MHEHIRAKEVTSFINEDVANVSHGSKRIGKEVKKETVATVKTVEEILRNIVVTVKTVSS